MKIYQLVQNLLVGDIWTGRQTGDVISPLLFLKESRVKMHTEFQPKNLWEVMIFKT
jgi:hypothetical protein